MSLDNDDPIAKLDPRDRRRLVMRRSPVLQVKPERAPNVANHVESDTQHNERPANGKRVAIVTSDALTLVTLRGDLISDIVRNGHQVLCCAPEFDASTLSHLRGLGAECALVPVASGPVKLIKEFDGFKELVRVYREWQPDVSLGYTPKGVVLNALAGARAEVSHIVSLFSGLGPDFVMAPDARSTRWLVRLYRLALSRSSVAIFHNDDDPELLKDLGGTPRDFSFQTLPGSGVDLDRFGYYPLPEIDEEGPVFLMVSSIVPRKGVHDFCAAAEAVRGSGRKAQFFLVGQTEAGAFGYAPEDVARFSEAVNFLGYQSDVLWAYQQCHAFVLPSYGEGLPRTVLEAMAVGRAIIASDIPGCDRTVDEVVNGKLFQPGDPEALAEAMALFIDRPELLLPLGQASRAKAERWFGRTDVNTRMMQLMALN